MELGKGRVWGWSMKQESWRDIQYLLYDYIVKLFEMFTNWQVTMTPVIEENSV